MARSLATARKQGLKELLSSGVVWQAEGEDLRIAPATLQYGDAISQDSAQYRVAPFGAAALDSALPEKGLVSGAIHEWLYKEHTEAPLLPLTIIGILAGNAIKSDGARSSWEEWHRYILWIGKECWPTPYLLQKALPHPALIKKCLFLDVPSEKERLWTIELALRSEAAFVTVAALQKLTFPVSKRFSIALSHTNRFAFFLRPCKSAPTLFTQQSRSAAVTRWFAEPYPGKEIHLKSPRKNTSQNAEKPLFVREEMALCWKVQLLKKKGALPERTLWPEENSWLFHIEENAFLEQDLSQHPFLQERYAIKAIPESKDNGTNFSRNLPSNMASKTRSKRLLSA